MSRFQFIRALMSGLAVMVPAGSALAQDVQTPTNARVYDPEDFPNEPEGMKPITLHTGEAVAPEGWSSHNPRGNITVISDEEAPVPTSGVIQYRYPEGLRGGNGVGMIRYGAGSVGSPRNMMADGEHVREIYISFWFRLDPQWQAPDFAGSKLFYVYALEPNVSRHHIFPGIVGRERLRMRFRNMVGARPALLGSNIADPELVRGEWYHLEIHARNASEPDANDGLVRWWLNGELCGDHPNLNRPALPWSELHGNMVWGGGSNIPVQRDQYIWLNHIYLSGRP